MLLHKTKFLYMGAILSLIPTLSLLAQEGHVGPVTDLIVIGRLTYSCSQGGVFVQHGAEESPALVFRSSFRVISLAGFSSGGDGHNDVLVLGGGQPGIAGQIGLLELRTKHFRTLKVAGDLVYSVATNGNQVAVACADGRVLTVGLPSMTETSIRVHHKHTAPARDVQFSPDGKWLASAGLDGIVILSRLNPMAASNGRQQPRPTVILQDHTAAVECLVFSPDSTLLASGARDGKVRLHTRLVDDRGNISGRLVRTYTGLGTDVESMRLGLNAHILALAWGGEPESLIAGTTQGTLYTLSLSDDQSERIPWNGTRPVYALDFYSARELNIGTEKVTRLSLP